jgi:hypothetical protein
MGVGMPADIYLHEFASLLIEVFGHHVYHVGSSLNNKTGWRDVDVRVILDDEEWDHWGFGDPTDTHRSGKWIALVLAFTELGRKMTGLPIDFQIQQMTDANTRFGRSQGCNRSALGLVPWRYKALRASGDGEDA